MEIYKLNSTKVLSLATMISSPGMLEHSLANWWIQAFTTLNVATWKSHDLLNCWGDGMPWDEIESLWAPEDSEIDGEPISSDDCETADAEGTNAFFKKCPMFEKSNGTLLHVLVHPCQVQRPRAPMRNPKRWRSYQICIPWSSVYLSCCRPFWEHRRCDLTTAELITRQYGICSHWSHIHSKQSCQYIVPKQ